jgi:hypothetical protein
VILAAEPDDAEALKLGTAAILTFRKKGAGNVASPSDSGKPSDADSMPAEASTDDLPVWEPNEKLAEDLGDYQDVDGIEIRLPKGFKGGVIPAVFPGTSIKLLHFSAEDSGGGNDATLDFFVQRIPLGQKPEMLDHSFEGMFSKVMGWQHAAVERGKIGDLLCLRARCNYAPAGPSPGPGPKMAGFAYLCQIDANTLVLVFAAEGTSQNVRALKIANTAALTIRKK